MSAASRGEPRRAGGAAELSKNGLFAHFRSKEELQVELLRAAEEALRREVVAPAMEAPEGPKGEDRNSYES